MLEKTQGSGVKAGSGDGDAQGTRWKWRCGGAPGKWREHGQRPGVGKVQKRSGRQETIRRGDTTTAGGAKRRATVAALHYDGRTKLRVRVGR